MKSKLQYPFAFSKTFLLEQYCSRTFYEQRMQMDGIEDSHIVSFEDSDTLMNMEIEREVEIHTDKAPAFIKKIADNLLSDSAVIATKVQWDKVKARGTNIIKARATPVEVLIVMQLEEKSETAALMKIELDVRAHIPLLGKRLEKFILPKAEKLLLKDCEKAQHYFENM